MKTNALILAAGLGTRMKSKRSKALQPLAGQYMIDHVLDLTENVGFNKNIVVVGYEKEAVMEALKDRDVKFAHQDDRLGTGHAVMMAKEFIDVDEAVIVLNCDTPLLSEKLISDFMEFHRAGGYKASLITTHVPDPHGYGRVVRDERNNVVRIVEEKDATDMERLITEINSGIYVFSGEELLNALSGLRNDNKQGEYYLTDCIEIIEGGGNSIGGFVCDDSDQLLGINTKVQLADAERIIRQRTCMDLMLQGVTIPDPQSVYIDKKARIRPDTVVLPGCHIKGATEIGEDCIIGPNTTIENSVVADCVKIENSTVIDSRVDEGTCVGPYAYVRPGSSIGKKVKIGDFVEIKNSSIGDGTKISHLSYVGDSDVGQRVNIGCGVVFVNYDGVRKHRSIVGDDAFIGCNVNLVSPVNVKEKAYIAAGSTVTEDVPSGALAIARARQTIKEDWVARKFGK